MTERLTFSHHLELERGNEEGLAMMRIPHELNEEFPREAQLIERLRSDDHDFGRVAALYDEVNQTIQRIESEEEPTSDEVLEDFKKRRLKLKDEIAAFLRKIESRM